VLGVIGAVLAVTGLLQIDAGAVVIGVWYLGGGLGLMGLALRPGRLFMHFRDALDDPTPRTSLEDGLETAGEVCIWFAYGCGLLGLILELA
jgi:hypothetical protein